MANIPSVPAEDLPPLSFIDRQISANLDATMFFVFLMAIYFIVYSATLYIYLSLKASRSRFIVVMMTLLFVLGMYQLGVQWGLLKWQFVNNGQTKETIFLSSYFIPTWIPVADAFTLYGSFVLADTLLIWRCFNVWNGSLRAIVVPCIFIVVEIGFYVTTIVLRLTMDVDNLTQKQAVILNATQSTFFFVSATTSMISTFLIAYRIHAVRRLEEVDTKFLNDVTDIVIQSGAVYSLTLLMSGIIAVLPSSSEFGSIGLVEASQYVDTILTAVSGIAPTLMIARVAMIGHGGRNEMASTYVSGLRFGTTSRASNGSYDIDDGAGVLHSSDKEQ